MALLSRLGAELDAALGTAHRIAAPQPPPAEPSSTAMLAALLEEEVGAGADPPCALRLAVSGARLHAPGQELVFGEAALGAGAAVVGLGALDGGTGCAAATLLERAVKLCIHECAHALGLEHCADPACVMYPARDIADLDRKARGFCPRCRADHAHVTLDAVRD